MKPGQIRKPYYAGFMYPGNKADLELALDCYISNAKQQVKDIEKIKSMAIP
jgi:predicted class III extradiol MEMO1 family dioxygenase